MKKVNNILIMAIALLSMSFNIQAQTVKETNNEFESLLIETLHVINQQKDAKGLLENVNKLKRLSMAYPNEWLADYYVMFFDIRLSFFTQDATKKELLLKEAKQTLEKLKAKDNTIESEILTLEGYYYYALIAQNPQQNGQLYYKNVIGAYQKAKAIDKNNPRPALMLLIFQQSMSKFTGGEVSNLCEKLSEVEQLFEKFKPISSIYPKWGKSMLKKEQQNCK